MGRSDVGNRCAQDTNMQSQSSRMEKEWERRNTIIITTIIILTILTIITITVFMMILIIIVVIISCTG